jgi:hypothetical protein
VCQYLTAGGVPSTGCPAAPTNPVVTLTDVSIAVTGKPSMQGKRVQVAYTHTFMFVGPLIGIMGGTWTNTKTITTLATMRAEIQTVPTP